MPSAVTRRGFLWLSGLCVLLALAGATALTRTGATYSAESTSVLRVSTPEQCARGGAVYDPYSEALDGLGSVLRWSFGSASNPALVSSDRAGAPLDVTGEGVSKTFSDLTCGESGALRLDEESSGRVSGAVTGSERLSVVAWVRVTAPGRIVTLSGNGCVLALSARAGGVVELTDGVTRAQANVVVDELTLVGVVVEGGTAHLLIGDTETGGVPCAGPISGVAAGAQDDETAAGVTFSDLAVVPGAITAARFQSLGAANTW